MDTATYSSPDVATWPAAASEVRPWIRTKYVVLAAAAVLALGFRVADLSTYGFSADELNKVRAIEQYRSGHFDANAEHPMLMKLAMWASFDLARLWNARAAGSDAMPIETAIRLPNAVAGAATTIVLFGVADLLFGGGVAAAAASIWAFDVNAIAINRIGKEDTFLLLFFLVAVYGYERAKQQGRQDPVRAQRWYAFSGAAFGLMLASKYMPHLLGVYALFNVVTDRNPGVNRPNRLWHYGAMAAAFLIANPAVVMPATWQYAADYVRGGRLAHHGYLYAGNLYVTNIPVSPLGVPATYYLRLIATKVPLVVLAAAGAGLVELVRRRRERGFTLLRVLSVLLLVPYSLMAPKFLRYSLPMLATLDLIAAVGLVSGIGWLLRKRWLRPMTRVTVSALAVGVFAGGLIASQKDAAPFYSLAQNSVGASLASPGFVFPESTYDYGVREATSAIAAAAAPSASIVSDAPDVVAYYLGRLGRPDLVARSLSRGGIPVDGREAWVIVQDEHMTFENQLVVEQLRRRYNPWSQLRVRGVVAAQVFRIADGGRCAAPSGRER